MNRVKVYIMGKSYSLQTAEEPGYAVRLSKQLDARMRELLAKAPSISVSDASILVALDLLDEREKGDVSSDHLREEVRDYITQANEANTHVAELQQQVAKLQADKEQLETALSLASLQSSLNKDK